MKRREFLRDKIGDAFITGVVYVFSIILFVKFLPLIAGLIAIIGSFLVALWRLARIHYSVERYMDEHDDDDHPEHQMD